MFASLCSNRCLPNEQQADVLRAIPAGPVVEVAAVGSQAADPRGSANGPARVGDGAAAVERAAAGGSAMEVDRQAGTPPGSRAHTHQGPAAVAVPGTEAASGGSGPGSSAGSPGRKRYRSPSDPTAKYLACVQGEMAEAVGHGGCPMEVDSGAGAGGNGASGGSAAAANVAMPTAARSRMTSAAAAAAPKKPRQRLLQLDEEDGAEALDPTETRSPQQLHASGVGNGAGAEGGEERAGAAGSRGRAGKGGRRRTAAGRPEDDVGRLLRVRCLAGDEGQHEAWGVAEWGSLLGSCDVVVATPALLLKAMTHAYVKVRRGEARLLPLSEHPVTRPERPAPGCLSWTRLTIALP